MDLTNRSNYIFAAIREISRDEKLNLRITSKECRQYAEGKEAEQKVSRLLSQAFPDMILLDDIYLDIAKLKSAIKGYDPTIQIDHILISNHAIYVIETKKYCEEGVISGSAGSKTWNYKDNIIRKTNRANAVSQNQSHLRYLAALLDLSHIPLVNVVCMVGIKEENIRVNYEYGNYVWGIDEIVIMIEALEKKYNYSSICKDDLAEKIRKINLEGESVEIEHIIFSKLQRRFARELSRGKRKRKTVG